MAEEQKQSAQDSALAEGDLLGDMLDELELEGEAADTARTGFEEFLRWFLTPERKGEKVDKKAVNAMIAEIDRKLSDQINEILHDPGVQKIESAWRGLKYMVDEMNFRENVRLEVLNCSKDDLIDDFDETPELVKSGLYETVYSSEYGMFGGNPYGMVVANYEFSKGPEDIQLLRNCAAVSAMSHAPFISNSSPDMFGCKSFTELPQKQDLAAIFEQTDWAKWNSFREEEDSRYVGLCGPRFLLRDVYGKAGKPVKSFDFEEEVVGDHDAYLWGGSATAFATRVADSFAKYRWCANIVGPQAGGAVKNLPLHTYKAMGESAYKIPTEVALTLRRDYEMSEQGFINLVHRQESDNAAFFSATSAQRPQQFGNTKEGKAAEMNFQLGTELPYIFIITRLAHYLKVLQIEQIGTWKERADLERELNNWISQYVTEMDNPSASVRASRPLREASVKVEEVPGQAGWYRCVLKVRPFFKYKGADFTLSLVGKLDKEK